MSTVLLAAVAVILCIFFRILNVNSQPQKPSIRCKDNKFLDAILKSSPLLQEPYVPTRLWGFSGHVQTLFHSIIGRVQSPWPIGERVFLSLQDGTTLPYDLFQPLTENFQDDISIAICPGIKNTIEATYVRTVVQWAQRHGYRVAVLNHVGALLNVPITSPRIFSYGNTDDFHEMIKNLLQRHPTTKIVCVGFSLGGNLIAKYMGEADRERPEHIIGGIAICEGYCAVKGMEWLLSWQKGRRMSLYFLTENMKRIILRHRHVLLSEEVKSRYKLNEYEIISAATLPELDEAYTRKVHGFGSTTELYSWSSSINYINNISKPMIFINSRDDPLVPEPLLELIKNRTKEKSNILYIEMTHGGHLGFYEGGLIYPNPITWLDRALVGLVGGLALYSSDSAMKTSTK